MCGIIGYTGIRDAAPVLYEGLKKLEYRGYDSCGIACIDNNHIEIKKDVGKVDEVDKKVNLKELTGNIGIAHTRWATHGGVTKENSHPHLSNNKKIAVVHNGILENYQQQKLFLESSGFVFYSGTDTEVIPNLIEFYMTNNNYNYTFVDAAKKTFQSLEGQYAIVAICDKTMVAIRKDAPLVIGLGKDEYFLASDITAFLEYTKDVIFLEENDMVIIDKNNLTIFNLNTDNLVERNAEHIEWDAEEAKKGNFDHYFLKEITEQAEVIERLANIDHDIIKDITNDIRNAKGIYIVACGTAAYASMLGAYLFSKIAKTHINFCLASEFEYFNHFLNDKSLIIAVSQSGETADTIGAIRVAKSRGAKVISITNTDCSTLKRESHKAILQKAGPEIAVNSTKAYTSQLAILSLIAYDLNGELEEGIGKLKGLPTFVRYLTSHSARKYVNELAKILKDKEHIYLIGRGLQYPTALEAAHKIKEASYIHAEAFAAGELKHGANALIEKGTPYIVFTSDENEKDILNNAMEVKSRGAYVIGVGPKNNQIFDFFIKVRDAGNYNPIVQIIPMQILAYTLAVIRGCDPDKPRNLAKSVTVK